MTEYCYKCDSSVMRHFIINDAIRKCVACGSNLSSRITKKEIKKLTTKAMFYTLDSTVFISLGNDMNHRSKPSSSMVAMSSHMGKGNLYTVSNQTTNMVSLAKMIINEDPDQFMDLLMAHFKLNNPEFKFKKQIKLDITNDHLSVTGIDEKLNDQQFVFK